MFFDDVVALRLRVLLCTHHLDPNETLVSLDPRIVSWRDSVRVTCSYSLLGPILQTDNQTSGNGVADMGKLAGVWDFASNFVTATGVVMCLSFLQIEIASVSFRLYADKVMAAEVPISSLVSRNSSVELFKPIPKRLTRSWIKTTVHNGCAVTDG